MRLRLFLDEDSMDQALVRALRARGVDVETALSTGRLRRPDVERKNPTRGVSPGLE